jgi:xylan 1,4-beta-xylosidase
MSRRSAASLGVLLFWAAASYGQTVSIRVDAASNTGPGRPVWAFFGYDEPNYTTMKHGRALIAALANLSPVPVHIRAHHLLCTGDGTAALKWGSTNAYTEDAAGRPVYNWTILDNIFDVYVQSGAKPFVEIGFMPEALSTNPQPYTRHWSKPDDGKGWSYPPKDYRKWAALIEAWARHEGERYGVDEASSWYWEVWNEPDISYWRGTPEEYARLYDYAVDAVKRALPRARVGGPATTGPASPKAAEFLRRFLDHTSHGTNYATGRRGSPMDFISFHAKGRPTVVDGHVRMGLAKNLEDAARGFQIVTSFAEYARTPIMLTESDPEGCAACSARTYPQNMYRNGPLYPAYTAAAFANIERLAARAGANLQGLLTWAFEFEDQPYFDGFRTLATNGIAKPVLNLFRMYGLMAGGARLEVSSSGAIPPDALMRTGAHEARYIDAQATRSDRSVTVLAWNYHDDDVPAPDATIRLAIKGLPSGVARILMRHYRIDGTHGNAYTVWQEMGSPQSPSAAQYARLSEAGKLDLIESPRWVTVNFGEFEALFALPRHAVSLVEVSW